MRLINSRFVEEVGSTLGPNLRKLSEIEWPHFSIIWNETKFQQTELKEIRDALYGQVFDTINIDANGRL